MGDVSIKHRPIPGEAASIGSDQLIRLDVAAALAFPDQSMTARGLRKEIDRGHLRAWKVAGRVYTTLHEVTAMRDRCEMQPRQDASRVVRHHARPSEPIAVGSAAQARLAAALQRLK